MTNKFALIVSGLVVFGLVACEEKKAADDAAVEPTAAVEATATEPAPAAEASTDSQSGTLLKEYEKFVDEYVGLVKKVKEGDAAAAQDMQKLAEKTQEWATKFAEKAESMTEADKEKLQGLAERIVKAATE